MEKFEKTRKRMGIKEEKEEAEIKAEEAKLEKEAKAEEARIKAEERRLEREEKEKKECISKKLKTNMTIS